MKRVTGNDSIILLGEIFTLRLEENPSTGYMWDLTLSDGLQILSDRYVPPTSNLPGSGRVHEWRIQGVHLGMQSISGTYRRPWESTAKAANSYHMNVMVDRP